MRDISSFIDNVILDELTRQAQKVANDAKKNAKWSSDIPDAISSTKAEKIGNGVFSVKVIVDLKKAPQARAFEYGSGIHATRGQAKKYPIAPKNVAHLAFDWPGRDPTWKHGKKFAGMLPDGRFLFNYVDHPGVKQNAFLWPAMESNRRSIRVGIARAFSKGVRNAFVAVEFNK